LSALGAATVRPNDAYAGTVGAGDAFLVFVAIIVRVGTQQLLVVVILVAVLDVVVAIIRFGATLRAATVLSDEATAGVVGARLSGHLTDIGPAFGAATVGSGDADTAPVRTRQSIEVLVVLVFQLVYFFVVHFVLL